jgi:hypothetical protein
MRQRITRWIVAIGFLVALAVSQLAGGTPTTVYGADPTPTPGQTNGNPGGSGGGGGG